MMEQKRGITMIQMVITIVMMILIAGFSIYNSRDTIIETKLSKTYNEMMTVKEAVLGLETLEIVDIKDIGTKLSDFSSYTQLMPYYNSGDNEYYLLDFKSNGDAISDVLEIRNIENNYIVNVKNMEDIEIFLVNGVKIGDNVYYSDDEILKKYNDIFAGR